MEVQCTNQKNLVELHSEINRHGENQFFEYGVITGSDSGFEFFPNTFHGSKNYENFKDIIFNIRRENETFSSRRSWKISTNVLNKTQVYDYLNEFNCYQIKNMCGLVKELDNTSKVDGDNSIEIREARSYNDVKVWTSLSKHGDLYSFLEMSTNLNIKMIICYSGQEAVATALGFVSKKNIGIYKLNVSKDNDKEKYTSLMIDRLCKMGLEMGCVTSTLQCNYSELDYFLNIGFEKENCYGIINI